MQSIIYSFNKTDSINKVMLTKVLSNLLTHYFQRFIISRPEFRFSNNLLTIVLYYYVQKSVLKGSSKKHLIHEFLVNKIAILKKELSGVNTILKLKQNPLLEQFSQFNNFGGLELPAATINIILKNVKLWRSVQNEGINTSRIQNKISSFSLLTEFIRSGNILSTSKMLTLRRTSLILLQMLLTQICGMPVKLKLIRVKNPSYNSSILAKYIRLNMRKYSLKRIFKLLRRKIAIAKQLDISTSPLYHSYVKGILIELCGRFSRRKGASRRTTRRLILGSPSGSQDKTFLTIRDKNGIISLKVHIASISPPYILENPEGPYLIFNNPEGPPPNK